jgi:predicted ATPase with chaperone activity
MQRSFVPTMTLVGLPDAAIKESGERVRAAIKNSRLVMPGNRLTINLARENYGEIARNLEVRRKSRASETK